MRCIQLDLAHGNLPLLLSTPPAFWFVLAADGTQFASLNRRKTPTEIVQIACFRSVQDGLIEQFSCSRVLYLFEIAKVNILSLV